MSTQLCYGQCSSFDCNKGYGWITPNDGSPDIFVHFSNINSNSSFKSLSPAQMVSYIPITCNNGKRKAVNVSVVTSLNQNTFTPNTNMINNTNNNNYNHHNNNNNTNQYNSFNNSNNNGITKQNSNTNQYNPFNNCNNNATTRNNNNNVISTSITNTNIQKHHSNNNRSNTPIQSMNIRDTNHESKSSNDCDVNIETRYKWQWKDDFGNWIDFTDNINKQILSTNNSTNYKIGQFSYTFVINSYNQTKGTQTNMNTSTQRECRKMQKRFAVYEGLTLKKMLESSWNDRYPSWWFDKHTKLHDAKLVEWPLDNEICVEIINMFNISSNQFCVPYNIEAIYSVQNKYLWKHYQFQRELQSEALGKNKLNERYLFHGTEYSATQKITVQGFLRDHGKIMAYGRGCYFAKNASMSIDYSPSDDNDNQWMFLCAVILGESTIGSRSYNVPPTKPNSSVHYESMVDDVTYPKIFVISKDYQAYPLFLIKFKQENAPMGLFGLRGPPGFSSLNSLNSLSSLNNNKKKSNKKKRCKTNKSLIPIKMKSVQKQITNMDTLSNQMVSSTSNTPKPAMLSTILPLLSSNNTSVPVPTAPPNLNYKIMQLQNQLFQSIKSSNSSIIPTYVPPINIPMAPATQSIGTMSSRYIGLNPPVTQSQQKQQPPPRYTLAPTYTNTVNIANKSTRNLGTVGNSITHNVSMQSANSNNNMQNISVTSMNNNNNNNTVNTPWYGRNTMPTQSMNTTQNNSNQSMNRTNSLPIGSAPTPPKWATYTAPIFDIMPTSTIPTTNTNNTLSNGPNLSPINEGSLYVGPSSTPRSLTPYPIAGSPMPPYPIAGSPMPPYPIAGSPIQLYLNSQTIAGSPMPPLNLLQIDDVNS